jgi:hypothetical protein
MFTAINCETDTAVSIRDTGSGDQHADSTRGEFRCLGCGELLNYHPEKEGSQSGPFVHASQSECLRDGNASKSHRISQEGVAKALYNWLPGVDVGQIDIERRIGTSSDFLIADVIVGPPICIAVEVVCRGTVSLRRRLQTMQEVNYRGMIVVVDDSQWPAARIDRYLRRLGVGQVGRFDPETFKLQFGSLLSPKQVDFSSPTWDQVPEYLT